MRVTIFGAGAVGSHIAAKLLRAGGAEISLVARGAHLLAMQRDGLTFQGDAEQFTVPVPVATDDPASLAPQDVVLVTLKSTGVAAAAQAIGRLLAPHGVAVFLLNGIPWWWHHGLPQPASTGQGTLPLLDPHGALWQAVGPARTLGGVIYSPNEIIRPGVVQHQSNRNSFIIGEPDGSLSARAQAVVDLLNAGGLRTKLSADVRGDIWQKLLLNATANTLAALTRLTAGERAEDPDVLAMSYALLDEVVATAMATGWDLAEQAKAPGLITPPGALAHTRPSMLQDVLLGRPLEVQGLLGQVQAFARAVQVPTPVIDIILPLLRGLDRSKLRAFAV